MNIIFKYTLTLLCFCLGASLYATDSCEEFLSRVSKDLKEREARRDKELLLVNESRRMVDLFYNEPTNMGQEEFILGLVNNIRELSKLVSAIEIKNTLIRAFKYGINKETNKEFPLIIDEDFYIELSIKNREFLLLGDRIRRRDRQLKHLNVFQVFKKKKIKEEIESLEEEKVKFLKNLKETIQPNNQHIAIIEDYLQLWLKEHEKSLEILTLVSEYLEKESTNPVISSLIQELRNKDIDFNISVPMREVYVGTLFYLEELQLITPNPNLEKLRHP